MLCKRFSNLFCITFQLVVQQTNLSHPFHIHGTSFHVIGMGRSPDTNVKKINLKHALDLDRRGLLHRQFGHPPLKDTIAVPNNGYVVVRFRADNPGKKSFFFFTNSDDMKTFYTKQNVSLIFRILVVPLSFPIPHSHWYESSVSHRNTCRFATSATWLSKMWPSFAAYQIPLALNVCAIDSRHR